MTTPSWQHDPVGRHEHRWWDGARWTDSVSDHGVIGLDPLGPPPPDHHAAPASHLPGVPLPPPTIGGGVATAVRAPVVMAPTVESVVAPAPPWWKRRSYWVVGGLVAVVALVIAGLVVISGDDDKGGGSTSSGPVMSGPVTEDDAVLVKGLDLEAGDVMRVRVEPSGDVDAMIVVAMDDSVADAWVEWARTNLPDVFDSSQTAEDVHNFFFTPGEEIWDSGAAGAAVEGMQAFVIDSGYEGEIDAMFLPVVTAGTYTVVVGSLSGDGTARTIVQVWDEQVDPVADAEQIYWQEPFDDEFFTETAFYEDSEPYTP